MKYKYVVFDWDGTLADTYAIISAAYDYAFEKMGLPKMLHDELKRIASTIQNREMLGYIFKGRKDEAAKYFYEYIEKYHTKNLVAQPGARELLDFCKKSGVESYLLTNKKTKFINEELLALGFAGYFKKVVAAGEYEHDKPHPVACYAVFDGKVPQPNEILVIGDGEADALTAKALNGADCLIYDPKQKYKGMVPTYKINRLIDAEAILENVDDR
ncbi:MAG: HAD family hydrolase [Rhodospirillales bacterium]|nr:HAD family hydrolase [Rhodospirillales bacterium]